MTTTQTPSTDERAAEIRDVRQITAAQLAQLGVSQMAYIKPVVVNEARAFAIHAADGTPMAVAVDELTAAAAIRQHDMFPLLVH